MIVRTPTQPVDVLGFPIHPFDTDDLVEHLVDSAASGKPTNVGYLNAHAFNMSLDDARFADDLRRFDVLYADGHSIVWAGRKLGRNLPHRLTAADYFERFSRRAAERRVSLFLLGGRPGVAARAAEALSERIPGLVVAGTHHGFFDTNDGESVVRAINAAAPDLLVVGMGSPRQERWVLRNAAVLDAPVRWCVGALFDYVAGIEPRAPRWLCRLHGEWLFRLLADPRGKWRRYLLGNPRFVWHVLRATRQARRADALLPDAAAPGFLAPSRVDSASPNSSSRMTHVTPPDSGGAPDV